MERTIYYKEFNLGTQRHKVFLRDKMSNEDFIQKVLFVRRIMGYAMYPRWFAIRMYLGEVYDMLRRNKLYKHRVKHMANALNKDFDAFEKLHTMDFDAEYIEVLGGGITNAILPKINEIRGAIGGILLREGIKHYLIYSYPETLCVLANEGVVKHDVLMAEVKQKYGFDLSEVFKPLRGYKVLASAYSLMSAVEDAVGEPLPMGVDARGSGADEKMLTLENMLTDDVLIRKCIAEAEDEVNQRLMSTEDAARLLSEKFNVKRL